MPIFGYSRKPSRGMGKPMRRRQSTFLDLPYEMWYWNGGNVFIEPPLLHFCKIKTNNS